MRLRWSAPEAVAERVRGYVIQRNPTATGQVAMRHYHTLSDARVTYLDTASIGPGQTVHLSGAGDSRSGKESSFEGVVDQGTG